ncbi:MAG: uroporphyrinogen decarboxylase family protein [Acetivibrionales bacterium]|jgi:uroporphyrinogen decarboxylase
MNSYERVMTAFNHKEPDRVPIAEWGVNENVWRRITPDARNEYEYQIKAGYDIIPVRIQYRIVKDNGSTFTNEWGVEFKHGAELTSCAVNYPFQDIRDISKLRIPDADDPYRFAHLEQVVRDFKGERAICFSTRACFLWAAELCRFDTFLLYLLTEPELASQLLDLILEHQIKVVRNAISIGADLILDTDDYAFNSGPLMSPSLFDEFFAPRIKKFTDAVHAAGAKMIKHSDGDIKLLLDSMVNTGIDGYHSIDPVAGMDIAEVKQQYGDRIVLMGNIDCGNLLSFGSVEDVRNAVRDCIKIAAPGGGFVLMTSNTVPYNANPANVKAMIDAAREFGTYPISL